MSRDLKFRVWNTVLKKYVCPNVVEQKDGLWLNLGNEDNLYEFEQYTGLKDKNGKEIYENDIVQVGFYDGSYKVLYQVVWRQSACRFILENDDREEAYPLKIDNDSSEVIGNIHESNMEELCPKE